MATQKAAAFQALTNGITSWNLHKDSVPCELLLTGDVPFPVLVNEKGQVLIAASFYGKGRMVVLSHEVYLMNTGLLPFLLNAVRWLCPSPGVPVGVHSSLKGLAEILKSSGMQTEIQDTPKSPPGVYCLTGYVDNMHTKLVQFVKAGGGLLIGGQAWVWVVKHGRKKLLSMYPGNQITSVAGVYFTDTYGEISSVQVSKNVPEIPLLVGFGQDLRKEQKHLLEGISELDIDIGGSFSHMLVHGPLAFPLGCNASLGCFLAAALYGQGRVVVATHEKLLETPNMSPFIVNAVRWLARGQTGKIGVNKDLQKVHKLLSGYGLPSSLKPQLSLDMSVYCCHAYSDKEAQQLQEFVAEGGGLLIGGQSWWWASQHPTESAMASFPGNVILNRLGLSILPKVMKSGKFPVPPPATPSSHFRKALSEFLALLPHRSEKMNQNWLKKLVTECTGFLQIPKEGIPVYESVHRLLLKKFLEVGFPPVSKEHPVAMDSCDGIMLSLTNELAHAGNDCSQLVQGLDGVTGEPSQKLITVEIDGNNPGDDYCWVSTGLYLPNGRSLEVSVSETLSSSGLKIQVGCHTNNLSKAKILFRAPVVTHKYSINRTSQSITGFWGGLLYVILPKGSQLGPQSVTIKGAVPAPYFKLGKTSLEEWKRCIQESQAPWGELATGNIILTVPSADLRKLEDPVPLLYLWDGVMEAIARLNALPFPFLRPERIVADVQVPEGKIHTGYPSICEDLVVQKLINESQLKSKGLFGLIHDLCQSQQRNWWTYLPHAIEVTCKLWSVYVHETVLGMKRAKVHPELIPDKRVKRIETHVDKGAPLSDWKEFTALETYLQLQEAFGWDPLTDIFAEYQILPEIPKDNADKMNLWVRKFSEKVQTNLVPFFRAWGWPVQKEVSKDLSALPDFETNPMRMYIRA